MLASRAMAVARTPLAVVQRGAATSVLNAHASVSGGEGAARVEAARTEEGRLSNGMHAVVRETGATGGITSLSLTVGAGSRHEQGPEARGGAFLLQLLAFKQTTNRSALRMMRDLENLGVDPAVGAVRCAAGREHVTYSLNCLQTHAQEAMAALAEAVMQPALPEWELREQAAGALAAHEAMHREDAVAQLRECVHAAAFGDNSPLGHSIMGLERAKSFSVARAVDFRNAHFRADNMVLSVAGAPMSWVEEAGAAAFSKFATASAAATPVSPYTGGERREWNLGSGDASVALALESKARGALGQVVGQVMENRLSLLRPDYSGTFTGAAHMTYTDTALLAVFGCGPATQGGALTDTLLNALKAPVTDEEFTAARARATLCALHAVENVCTGADSLGKAMVTGEQYLVQTSDHALAEQFSAVTAKDVNDALDAARKTPLSVAAAGDLDYIPRRDQITNGATL